MVAFQMMLVMMVPTEMMPTTSFEVAVVQLHQMKAAEQNRAS